jgi:hypothetical protein
MKSILAGLLVLLMTGTCFAQMGMLNLAGGTGTSTMASKMTNGIGIGVVQAGGESVGAVTWHPDFKTGPFGIGLDVNIPLGDKRPADFESVVVRYAEYDSGTWGVKYGILDKVTYGSGLLMNNYSTRTKGGALLSNKQVGVKAYLGGGLVGYDMATLHMLGTWSNLYVVRLTEKVLPQLTLGQTYITDTNGVGTLEAQSGYGIDAIVPLFTGAQLYAEYAKLINYGAGYNAGLGLAYNLSSMLDFKLNAEWRAIESNFIPGYYNEQYETNPLNLSKYSGKAQTGYVANLGITSTLPQGNFTLAGKYEDYLNTRANIGAELTGQFMEYEVAGSYEQPNFGDNRGLSFEQGAIIRGTVAYKVNPFTKVTGKYKKAYDPDKGQVVESMVYEASLEF